MTHISKFHQRFFFYFFSCWFSVVFITFFCWFSVFNTLFCEQGFGIVIIIAGLFIRAYVTNKTWLKIYICCLMWHAYFLFAWVLTDFSSFFLVTHFHLNVFGMEIWRKTSLLDISDTFWVFFFCYSHVCVHFVAV